MRLTRAQREMLERAVADPTGNPWPSIEMRRRAGGALSRCFERMRAGSTRETASPTLAAKPSTPTQEASVSERETRAAISGVL